MSGALPVTYTRNFTEYFHSIPVRDQKRIEYDITHIDRQDALRKGRLKGDLNYYRKMRCGDYRILFAYCADCYEEFKDKINCEICDENDLERIIIFFIFYRKKAYDPRKFSHIDITKIKF